MRSLNNFWTLSLERVSSSLNGNGWRFIAKSRHFALNHPRSFAVQLAKFLSSVLTALRGLPLLSFIGLRTCRNISQKNFGTLNDPRCPRKFANQNCPETRVRGYLCLRTALQLCGNVPLRTRRHTMSQKAFSLVAGLVFLLVAVVHLLRLLLKWSVIFNGWTVPMWVSWGAVVIAAFLAFEGLRRPQ